MVDNDKYLLVEDLKGLVEENSVPASGTIDVADADTPDDALVMIREYFATNKTSTIVNITVDEALVGVIAEPTVGKQERTAADPAATSEAGIGDRIQLAGLSTRYRLLEFDCPRCAATAYRIHYDPRNLPACTTPNCAEGEMELRR